MARTPAELERALAGLAAGWGYAWYVYFAAGPGGRVGQLSLAPGFRRLYVAREYERIDPVLRRASAGPVTLAWSADGMGDSGTVQALGREMRRFDIVSGITASVNDRCGEVAMLTLADGAAGPARGEGDASLVSKAAAYYRLHHARVAAPAAGGARLTRAQRDVVAWTARGKTIADVAGILGVHEATVRYHIREAKARLGAATLAQLAAAAVRRGEVTP